MSVKFGKHYVNILMVDLIMTMAVGITGGRLSGVLVDMIRMNSLDSLIHVKGAITLGWVGGV